MEKNEYFINSDSLTSKNNNFLGHFLHGLKLKSYEFNKYKTKKENRIITIFITGNKNKPSSQKSIKIQVIRGRYFFCKIWFQNLEMFCIQMNMLNV